jgi:hypothetical protein
MNEFSLINDLCSAWSWCGLKPTRIIAENDFGNLIIEDIDGSFWRLCPEECSCTKIASSFSELESVRNSPEFVEDWEMARIVEVAQTVCGPLSDGKKYALKIPACLGGDYVGNNFAIVPFGELIGFSGSIASQAKDLSDGTEVELRIIDHPDQA